MTATLTAGIIGAPVSGALLSVRGFGLAGPGLTDVDQADERGHAGHAKHAECGRHRRRARIELPEILSVRHGVLLPAVVTGDDVAGAKRRIARLDDLTHRVAAHDVAEIHRRRVRGRVAHASTHVWIDRQIDRPSPHVAVRNRQKRNVDGAEIRRSRHSDGTAFQQNPAILSVHDGPSYLVRRRAPQGPPGSSNAGPPTLRNRAAAKTKGARV